MLNFKSKFSAHLNGKIQRLNRRFSQGGTEAETEALECERRKLAACLLAENEMLLDAAASPSERQELLADRERLNGSVDSIDQRMVNRFRRSMETCMWER